MAIQTLSRDVVDQIAAGEVVERPAHMLKELLENSIDAKASEIEIEFENGGRYVKVVDNGSGIEKEDLALALSRHATSKIENTNDLWTLQSFGFRGEALASIASVSDLRLTSQTQDSDSAWEIRSEFGQVSEPAEVSGTSGTTIIVNRLFENTPARLKFLKSDGAESAQIKNVIKALAMAHPEISFRVRNRGSLLYFWPGTESKLERVKAVLDQSDMYEADFEYEYGKAHVVLCPPQVTTGNSKQIWGFVQGRWVQDRSLQAAIMDAYRNLLMHGEFPIAAYWLEVPSDEVDVNIHPTKSQVKFSDNKVAFRSVNRAARTLLESAPWLGDLIPEGESFDLNQRPESPVVKAVEQYSEKFKAPEFNNVQFAKKEVPLFDLGASGSTAKVNLDQPGVVLSEATLDMNEPDEVETKATNEAKWSRLQVLGQANLTYILAQSEKAMVVVDQHAAHERVMFERVMDAWKGSKIDIQNFLLPLTVTLSEDQVEAIAQHIDELAKLGLSVEQSGPQELAVVSAPHQVSEKSIVKTLERLGRELLDHGDSFAFEKVVGDIVATIACHSAIRAGQALGMEQMQSLLEQMDEHPLSSFCPHGRPVFVEYPFSKLERDFGRIV